jgi:hypothetical protein
VHILEKGMKRLFASAIAIGLLTACAGVTAPGASKAQTPQQSLADTARAMGQLKSAKFDVNGTVNVTLPQALVDQLKAKGGSQAGVLSSNMTVTLKISGAAQKPDQLQANVSAKLGGLTIETEVIAAGGNLYYKDPMSGKWEMVKKSPEAAKTPGSKPKLSYQTVLNTAKSVTEVNDASSTINGTTVEHYRIVPDLVKLFAQITAGHTSGNSAGLTAIQTVLQNASLQADVWSGTSDHLIRRLSYDADVSADLHELATAFGKSATAKAPTFDLPAGSVAHVTAHVVIDLHDFNSQLTIKAPTVG